MTLPALISAQTLQEHLQDENLLIIDLRSPEEYAAGHIPGAVNVPPSAIQLGEKPAPGKLPSLDTLTALFSRIGYSPEQHIVTYDDAGGSWAGRMIWTLDVINHANASMLDGGIHAWQAIATSQTEPPEVTATEVTLQLNHDPIITKEEILSKLDDANFITWDARTQEEYNGSKVLAEKGGHIPGAVHCEWTELHTPNGTLKPLNDIQALLNSKGLNKEKTIATHCQTHRRSGLTYFVAKKLLSYEHIKAYPGSWSEWGNSSDTPVE